MQYLAPLVRLMCFTHLPSLSPCVLREQLSWRHIGMSARSFFIIFETAATCFVFPFLAQKRAFPTKSKWNVNPACSGTPPIRSFCSLSLLRSEKIPKFKNCKLHAEQILAVRFCTGICYICTIFYNLYFTIVKYITVFFNCSFILWVKKKWFSLLCHLLIRDVFFIVTISWELG